MVQVSHPEHEEQQRHHSGTEGRTRDGVAEQQRNGPGTSIGNAGKNTMFCWPTGPMRGVYS